MRREGFTILEILIVVGLIGVLMAVGLSRLRSGSAVYLDAATRELSSNLRFTAQSAIASSRTHRMLFDLDDQRFRIEEEVPIVEEEDEELASTANLLDLAPPIPEREFQPLKNYDWDVLEEGDVEDLDVRIDLIAIGDQEYGEGEVSIAFSGDGGSDPAEIWLSNQNGHSNGLRVLPFTGEVRGIPDEER